MYCKYCGKAVDLTTMRCVSCGREVGPLSGGTGFWDLLEPPAGLDPAQAAEPVGAAQTVAPAKPETDTEPKPEDQIAQAQAALAQAQAEAEAARRALLEQQKLNVEARLALGRRTRRAGLIAIISTALFVLALVGVILLWIHVGSLKSELSELRGESATAPVSGEENAPVIPSFQHSVDEDKPDKPGEPDNPVSPAQSTEPAPPQSSEAAPPETSTNSIAPLPDEDESENGSETESEAQS